MPSGKGVDVGVGLVLEIDQSEQVGDERGSGLGTHPVGGSEEVEVLGGVQALVDAEYVGHPADQPPNRLRIDLRIDSADPHRPAVAGEEARHEKHGGGLPGSVRADESHHRPVGDGQVGAVERPHLAVPLVDAVQLDDHAPAASQLSRCS